MSRGLGDVYKRQLQELSIKCLLQKHETEVSQRRFTLQRGSSFFITVSETTVDFERDFSICTLSLRKEVSRMKILVWEMRTSKGFTLMELSKKSGIGKSTINNIENGKVSPTLFQLEMIAIALGVNITDLFESEYK